MHKNKHIAPRTDRIRILVAIREPLHLGDPILRTGYCLARIVAVEHIRHLQELDRPGFRDQCITRSLSGTDDIVVAHLPLLRQQALRPRRSYQLTDSTQRRQCSADAGNISAGVLPDGDRANNDASAHWSLYQRSNHALRSRGNGEICIIFCAIERIASQSFRGVLSEPSTSKSILLRFAVVTERLRVAIRILWKSAVAICYNHNSQDCYTVPKFPFGTCFLLCLRLSGHGE